MKTKIIGVILLGVIIIVGISYQQFFSREQAVVLKGYVGGEKLNFLENPDVQEILRNTYGIALEITKAGSIEMVKEPPTSEIDFLWPSSQVALELFKMNQYPLVKSEIIFNSPIVLYSWDLVTQQLQQEGFVEQEGQTFYVKEFKRLIEEIIDGKTWAEIGLDALFGKIAITTTDPTKSNSGNMFAGLLANVLYGDVVDVDSIQPLLPTIHQIFARLGYMPPSSHDLFQQYLTKGIGDKPIIVGYENQVVEFSLQNEKLWPRVKEKIRILYPRPTVWSSHPLIILNDRANGLIQALQDEEIQAIAWEQHGFRTGLMGVQNDPEVLDIVGIPENITQVIPMPSPAVMDQIITVLLRGNTT
ncbi:hypothetical protein GF339_10605 [candidate division KSB3 bacterium]|uniref:Uncharacterized protein n=1 Tax=candidate division KSB3 bacterium TaxID=2044937 RepID=A0A9D5JW36_9BACT|nr:hypothetical protein [candidate division KSB3 bacterium]MBD3325026.1 hypothetical protein [candidate division KSB3 bacterium]